MKLYTKTGDAGETGLASGARVKKTTLRITSIGEVDELNSFIGQARFHCKDKDEDVLLQGIQEDLFVIGSELAQAASVKHIEFTDVEKLEKAIDAASEKTTPLCNFVLPGGCGYAAALHVCRSVCRRAERSVLALEEKEMVNAQLKIYLNRLSDLCFALARKANKDAGVEDTIWKPTR